jgi:hypothetical protein
MVTWRIPQSLLFRLRVRTPGSGPKGARFKSRPGSKFDGDISINLFISWKIRILLSKYEFKKKKKWITQIFGLRISFLYTPGALWSWNLHVDRALGVMDNAVWAGGVTSGVDSHIGPHWQNFYNFVNAASKGLGTRRQRSAFPYLLQKNFPSKIF